MKLSVPNFVKALWERNSKGENWYYLDGESGYSDWTDNLDMAENHPILTPAILFVSKLFSQAEFKVVNKKTGKEVHNHWMVNLLNNPNYYQTQNDFLESLMFMQIANGVAVGYKKRNLVFDNNKNTNSIYLLDYNLIKWPEEFKTPMKNRVAFDKFKKTKIRYDVDGEDIEIALKDLLFFYDLPNGLKRNNKFEVSSRIDGLKQTLLNTKDSLIAKNIILKTNGKELISGTKDGFPLDTDEKREAEALFNTGYGLSKRRKRGLITKANVNWKSLHIALRDLGLDESVKVDGNLIYTALHIPKDILSLEAKKTTYNNFKESMVSYVQNEMQSSLNAFCEVFSRDLEDENKLVGSYEHLPIMQFILIERYKVKEGLGRALSSLRSAGLPDDIALTEVGLDPTIKLNELKSNQNENNNRNQSESQQNGNEEDNSE